MPLLKHVAKITSAKLAPGDGNQTKLLINFSVTLKSEVGFSAVPMIAKLTGQSIYMSIYGDQLEFPTNDDEAERMARDALAKEHGQSPKEPELDLDGENDAHE
jgi:hypothetical protein